MMKALFIALALLAFATPSFARGRQSTGRASHSSRSSGDVRVRGYTKKSGKYVKPHMRSHPDKTKLNNFSTRGNTNPYTGAPGTVDPNKPK